MGSRATVVASRTPIGTALLWLILPVASVVLPACNRGDDSIPAVSRQFPLVPMDTGLVVIESGTDTSTLRVEIAETPRQTSVGLMDRASLPADEGMIFLFPETRPATAAFWMFRTPIPLDIAFLDAEGRILVIREMSPCTSPNPAFCDEYVPGTPYIAALEANRGFFAARGIVPGDRVVLQRQETVKGDGSP